MFVNLKNYQRVAVDELLEKSRKLLARDTRQTVCIFKSPTGSGKTVMTASFIKQLIREIPHTHLCFLWLSVGKGELHLQSARSLRQMFDGTPRVSLIDEEFHGGRDRIKRNEVVVANWEKLFSQNRKGEWTNRVMRDGEKWNFREVVARTHNTLKIVLIIDESHYGCEAKRITELREIFDPDLIIEMSATPKMDLDMATAQRGLEVVEVSKYAAVEEGMIKKAIPINPEIDAAEYIGKDSENAILNMAYDKRLKLKTLLEHGKANINPLVLVQMPNAEAGEEKIKIVRDFLRAKGINEDNGKLAIWLSGNQSDNLSGIAAPDNEIEFLIFKQAVAMGWDCPRAHILVKFREPGTETFEIQTVGRIGRMPEWKHYATEELNNAYIYTNNGSYSAQGDEFSPNIINDLKAKRQDSYRDIDLVSYYKSRADYGDISSVSFIPVFEKTACDYFGISNNYAMVEENFKAMEKKGIDFETGALTHNMIADVDIEPPWDASVTLYGQSGRAREVSISDTKIYFRQIIKNHLGAFTNIKRSVPAVEQTIHVWFQKFLGVESCWTNEAYLKTQRVFMRPKNKRHFITVLSKAAAEYKEVREKEVLEKIEKSEQHPTFNIKPEYLFNHDAYQEMPHPQSVLQPCYLEKTRSQPEKSFEKFLDAHADKIKWWWKNGKNSQDYFAIRYEYGDGDGVKMPHAFYPDYLVQLEDGRLAILETKDDTEKSRKTKAKSEELQRYIAKHNRSNKKVEIFGGIVIWHDGYWRINQAETYQTTNEGDINWKKWKVLDFASMVE